MEPVLAQKGCHLVYKWKKSTFVWEGDLQFKYTHDWGKTLGSASTISVSDSVSQWVTTLSLEVYFLVNRYR